MLDIKTKKAIDDARNILVGKTPSPNIQVEQITIAMLYKFMDDMDQESIQLGGKATFFADDFEKYSWRTIMSKTLGAQERFNRYIEALEKFYSRPKLPQTFKDIFKNATVPYRDADVLTMFLRTIDEGLSYGDSEQLGDAYEYLLMILGSQGDLGQFRTPRHIIDMMVEIVDPQKGDLVLDPACGTAGFLISAYKHILKNNMDEKPGDKMNFDERVEVLKHITGYDIEPSMVRIAEMNMFLHGATDPDIHEYDTLTMEDRWEEKFNVILANPPFMTPKGGIKPHKRFGIKANRAEVLFVDYISSHLRAEGRAAIIVPEGIVYQSGKAFKEIRKSLISSSLYAVISLPQGVFNPYSGIKTCILFLDKTISQRIDNILFVKVKNDGFSLGTQRNFVNNSELPDIIKFMKSYKESLIENKVTDLHQYPNLINNIKIIKKTNINENNQYTLDGERYNNKEKVICQKYESKKIGDLFISGRGRVISKQYIENNTGIYPVYSSQTQNNGILGYINSYDYDDTIITWTTDGANAGTVFNRNGKFNCTNVCGTLKLKDNMKEDINLEYVTLMLNKVAKKYVSIASGNPKLMNNVMESIVIPVPNIEIQNKLVNEVKIQQEKKEKIILSMKECDNKIEQVIENFWN